jgi:heme ABC exporter ATP-binding subunit CcmA
VSEERQAARVVQNDSEARVELRAVTKTYGPVRALVGVSARFDAGCVSMVLGPNGSGKSTLLSILGTLARPTSGKVLHGALGRTREEVRTVLGWVGHDSLCYGDLTGRENIELAAKLHGLAPQPAFESARARFDLAAFAERPFRTYSRGQRQRVALARALVHAPLLLLLDEPTTGLDARSVESLQAVVRAEAARGAVVVVITHDEVFAKAAGDVRVVLERGRIKPDEAATTS